MAELAQIEVPASGPIRVALEDAARAYDVVIGRDLLAQADVFLGPLLGRARVVVVTDETVAGLHLPTLESALSRLDVQVSNLVLPAGEQTKSFAGLERVVDALLAAELERRDFVIALGGGVIGDLAGFAAGVLKRGIDFVQIPTTLLAQVDSSVGGKTAINAKAGKNLVGLFHQPRLVLADIDALDTLPVRERLAGWAEVVKYGLIADRAFFDWCLAHARDARLGKPDVLEHAVRVSVARKAQVVALDEREGGVRALLNLGHTFGHALEARTGFGAQLLHGEAVALGTCMAYRFAARRDLCPAGDAQAVEQAFSQAGMLTRLGPLMAQTGTRFDAGDLLKLMRQDKKAEGGAITLITPRAIGDCFVERNVSPDALRGFLSDEIEAQP